VGRTGSRRLLAGGKTSDQPAVGYYVVTWASTATRPQRGGRQRSPRRSWARASAVPAVTTTRWNATRRMISTTSPPSSRGFGCSVQTRRRGLPRSARRAGQRRTTGDEAEGGCDAAADRRVPGAATLDRSPMSGFAPDQDPRVPLVKWITDPKNEFSPGRW